MNDLLWSWALTIVGATCFYLAGGLNGRKVWWAWYIGLFAQVLWATYAFLDLEHRMGFLVGVALYGFVYVRNCVNWTREHRAAKRQRPTPEDAPVIRHPKTVRDQDFPIGMPVQLATPDRYLLEQHNVIPNETIGTVTAWSNLADDDFGVLVLWEWSNSDVRCDPRELVPLPATMTIRTGWTVPRDQFYSPYGSTPEEHNAAVEEIQRTEDETLRAALDATRPPRGGIKFTEWKGPEA
ncbi:membrane protein [Microbacterium phage Grassboy]|nr:membrane protein [Microbacterium phage Grassboy]